MCVYVSELRVSCFVCCALLIQLKFIVVILTKLCLVWTIPTEFYFIPENVAKLWDHFRLSPLNETFSWPHTKAFFYLNSKLLNETSYKIAMVTHLIFNFFLLPKYKEEDLSWCSIYLKQNQFWLFGIFTHCSSFLVSFDIVWCHTLMFDAWRMKAQKVFTLKEDAQSKQNFAV